MAKDRQSVGSGGKEAAQRRGWSLWRRRIRAVRRAWLFGVSWVAAAVVSRLSRRGVLRLAGGLACLAYRFDRTGRRVAEANLALVYGEGFSRYRRDLLVRGSYRTAARTMLELAWFSHKRVERVTELYEMAVESQETMGRGAGVIVSAHIGNWELGGQISSKYCRDLVSIAMPYQGALLTRLVAKLREVLVVRRTFRIFHDKEKMRRLGDVSLNKRLLDTYFSDFDVTITPTDWFVMLDKLYLRLLPKALVTMVRKLSHLHFWLDRRISTSSRVALMLSGSVLTEISK